MILLALALLFSSDSQAIDLPENYGIISEVMHCTHKECSVLVETVEGVIKCTVPHDKVGKRIPLDRFRGELVCR